MQRAQIGIYGLGTMGSALAMNLAENGIVTAVANREQDWVAPFLAEAGELGKNLIAGDDLADFVSKLQSPRLVLFMIPSGAPLDAMLDQVLPLLDAGDTIIDAGNADFNATIQRSMRVETAGISYVGMGVSGGEDGARHGPSMMFGGSQNSWTQLEPILNAIAAKYEGAPCVDRMGPDGAGHFVKTVHNGIEYADMQMIAEVYGLLRDGAEMDAATIGEMFENWSTGALSSFLIDVTAKALGSVDQVTGKPMVDVIRDAAGQKGTGRWTLIEALKLGQSASTIEAAVGARSWSSQKDLREIAAQSFPAIKHNTMPLPEQTLQDALLAGRILSHAQGFNLMRAASNEQGWDLNLARIAEIWRAGCILRSVLLDDIAEAFASNPPKGELILADQMTQRLTEALPALRSVVAYAVTAGLPVPALSGALAWFDTMRQARGTANMIQAQRDIFGAHGFERIDAVGKHHGSWN